MKLTVLCGLPNAGKSTFAESMANDETVVIGFDECLSDYSSKIVRNEMRLSEVYDVVFSKLREALLNGKNAVYDSVNPTAKERRIFIEKFSDIPGIEMVCLYVDTPIEVCVTRTRNPYVAKAYSRIFEPPTEDEGFDEIIVYHDDVEEPEPEHVLSNSERIANLETAVEELQIIDSGAREIMDILEGNAE